MKPGTRVFVTHIRPEGDVTEMATVRRTTSAMLPLPAGYMPLRFVAEGATLLVHESRISAQAGY